MRHKGFSWPPCSFDFIFLVNNGCELKKTLKEVQSFFVVLRRDNDSLRGISEERSAPKDARGTFYFL